VELILFYLIKLYISWYQKVIKFEVKHFLCKSRDQWVIKSWIVRNNSNSIFKCDNYSSNHLYLIFSQISNYLTSFSHNHSFRCYQTYMMFVSWIANLSSVMWYEESYIYLFVSSFNIICSSSFYSYE